MSNINHVTEQDDLVNISADCSGTAIDEEFLKH